MDIPEPEMILLIGIPASGKSTFYRQRFAETHLQISLDILHSRVREMEVLQAALAAECPWKKIECQDWIWLLQDRPEFAEHCLCWNEFSDSDWTFLQKTQPQLVKNYRRS